MSDVGRIVNAFESGGWFLDRVAYAEIVPVLLQSVCRASESARMLAAEELERRTRSLGDPRQVLAEEGGRIDGRFKDARTASREREALRRAITSAPDDCPFWVRPALSFAGLQTGRHRFTLTLETGGNVQIRETQSSWTFGGGGVARVLPGYGFGEHWSLLTGVEFGGGAMLRPGSPRTEFSVNYFPAIPLVLRYRDVSWHYDFELGAVGLFQADNIHLSPGGRIGTSIGVSALRTRGVVPWAGIAATYEYYVGSGDRPAAHFLRGGLRVGVMWDAL